MARPQVWHTPCFLGLQFGFHRDLCSKTSINKVLVLQVFTITWPTGASFFVFLGPFFFSGHSFFSFYILGCVYFGFGWRLPTTTTTTTLAIIVVLLFYFFFFCWVLVSDPSFWSLSFVALLSTGLAIIPTHGHIDGNFASSCCWCCSVSHNRRTVIIIIASGSFEFEVAKQMKGSGSQWTADESVLRQEEQKNTQNKKIAQMWWLWVSKSWRWRTSRRRDGKGFTRW
jgi:hypothetical protein